MQASTKAEILPSEVSSDSLKSAERELAYFFDKAELQKRF